jgi:hypothetical protein
MKEAFEDIFKHILDNLGYDGTEAGIVMNFGPEEVAEYAIPDIFTAVKEGIIIKNEARNLLSKYHKWDITGDVEGGDKPVEPMKAKLPVKGPEGQPHKEESVDSLPNPQIVITPLSDAIARFNGDISKVYIDPLVPDIYYDIIKAREVFEWQLIFKLGMTYEQGERLADIHEKATAISKGIDYEIYQSKCKEILSMISGREEKIQNPSDCIIYEGE